MRKWVRANHRKHRNLPRCIHCKQPIPRSEPDVILQDLMGEKLPGYFHERCSIGAYALAAFDEPGAWRITHRHIDERMN